MSSGHDAPPPEVLLEGLPPTMIAIAQGLREVILTAVPEGVERVRLGWQVIGYDVPVGRRTAFFAWIWPQREHVHLGFPKGVSLLDPDHVLGSEGIAKSARWFTLTQPEHLTDPRLAEFARAAADFAALGRR